MNFFLKDLLLKLRLFINIAFELIETNKLFKIKLLWKDVNSLKWFILLNCLIKTFNFNLIQWCTMLGEC